MELLDEVELTLSEKVFLLASRTFLINALCCCSPGDSYIVLHTYGDASTKKAHDIHFWLGKTTSQVGPAHSTLIYKASMHIAPVRQCQYFLNVSASFSSAHQCCHFSSSQSQRLGLKGWRSGKFSGSRTDVSCYSASPTG